MTLLKYLLAFVLLTVSACDSASDLDLTLANTKGKLVLTGLKGYRTLDLYDAKTKKTVSLGNGHYRIRFLSGLFSSDLLEFYSDRSQNIPVVTVDLEDVTFNSENQFYGQSTKIGQTVSFSGGKRKQYIEKSYLTKIDVPCKIEACYEERLWRVKLYECGYTSVDAAGTQKYISQTCKRKEYYQQPRACKGDQQELWSNHRYQNSYEVTFYAGQLDPVANFYQSGKILAERGLMDSTQCEEIDKRKREYTSQSESEFTQASGILERNLTIPSGAKVAAPEGVFYPVSKKDPPTATTPTSEPAKIKMESSDSQASDKKPSAMSTYGTDQNGKRIRLKKDGTEWKTRGKAKRSEESEIE